VDYHGGVVEEQRTYETPDLTSAYISGLTTAAKVPIYGLSAEAIKPLYIPVDVSEIEHPKHPMVESVLNNLMTA
jgi:hypothetical protein